MYQYGSTPASSRTFAADADDSMNFSPKTITELTDDAEVDDGKEAIDKNRDDVRAPVNELKARQQKEQARRLAELRGQVPGQQDYTAQPTPRKEARPELLKAQQQLREAQKQLREAQQQLQQAFHQVRQLQHPYSRWAAPNPWSMRDQWAAPNRWTCFEPYGCGCFAPAFRYAYTSPFTPSCSPYGMSFEDRCAFSPFGSFGSALASGLTGLGGLAGAGIGAALGAFLSA